MKYFSPPLIFRIVLIGIALFFGVSFFWWTLLPYTQVSHYYDILRQIKRNDMSFVKDNTLLLPHTYAQPKLQRSLIESLVSDFQEEKEAIPALVFFLKQYEITEQHEHEDPLYYTTLARGYTALAKMTQDYDTYLPYAEKNYQSALKLWPNSPELVFEYALNLINTKKSGLALEIIDNLIALEPAIYQLYYYKGFALYQLGSKNYENTLSNFETMFSRGKNVDGVSTNAIYTNLFSYFYKKKDIERFITVAKRLVEIDPDRDDLYKSILEYYKTKHYLPLIQIE